MDRLEMLKDGLPFKKADDLFDKSSMSFGSHLEELRRCLIWAIGFLFGGMLIGLLFAESVVNYVQTPLKKSLDEFYADRASRLVEMRGGGVLPQNFKDFLIASSLTAELVYLAPAELIYPADESQNAVSDSESTPAVDGAATEVQSPTLTTEQQVVADRAKELMEQKYQAPELEKLKPYWRAQKMPANTEALGLQEPFMIWLKAAFVVGAVIASPGIFYSLWTFVAAGLYPHERKYVYFFLPAALGLFLSGAALAFFVIFELVIQFLLRFNDSLGIGASPRLNDYMSFALFLPLGFGIAFQLPLVMFVLERIGIISVATYISQWRTAILLITFLSMILTPAEVTSMIGMGVPLIGLYFLGIALCTYFPRRGFDAEKGYDPV